MDVRLRKLKNEDSSAMLSRSLPTSRTFPVTNKTSCFQQCLNSSTDSLNSAGCRSPKLGHYRKLPNRYECDMCHMTLKDVTDLKCFHSACSKCLEKWKIEQNGCPLCRKYPSGSQNSSNSESERSNGTQHHSAEDLIFDDLDLDAESESIEELVNRLETEILKNLCDKHAELKNEQSLIVKDAKEQIEKINEHVRNLKILIDKKAETLIKLVQDSKTRHLKELEQQDTHLKQFQRQVQDSLKHFRGSNSDSDEGKRKAEDKLREMAKLADQIVTENIHIRYNVKPPSDVVLDNLVGKVGVRVFLGKCLKPQLIKMHVVPAVVQTVCPINSQQAWVGYQSCVQLCSKTGHRAPALDLGEDVQDMCLTDSGDVLVACQSSVKVIHGNKLIETLFPCPEPPRGISCMKNGYIILCSGNKVNIYSKQGEKISELDGNGIGNTKIPFKVATNVNGDICITDFHSTTGDVAIFNSSGEVFARIRTDGVAPRGLSCSHQGWIYVCDFRADRINMYSPHGHFLQTILTSTHGLSGPLSVALDPCDDLWVGDWKGKVRIFSQSLDAGSSGTTANSA